MRDILISEVKKLIAKWGREEAIAQVKTQALMELLAEIDRAEGEIDGQQHPKPVGTET